MIFRDARPADLPAIEALFRRSFTATFGHLYAENNLAKFLDSATPDLDPAKSELAFRLAERDGVLLGYAKIGGIRLPVRPRGPAVELRQLYLDEGAKGAGIADALMAWVIDSAHQRAAGEIFLSVYTDNHRAQRFYARHGFEAIGHYAFRVGDHIDDDLLMRRVL